MAKILCVMIFIIFALLSALHFYWLIGGRWAIDKAIPTTEEHKKMFSPGPIATFIVAIGLLMMGLLFLINSHIIHLTLPRLIEQYGIVAIGCIFIIRAIGDFRYVGFFKKIKATSFGQNDTKYYSPLCFLLGLSSLYVAWLSF